MKKKDLFRLAIITVIIGIAVLAIAFFFFHFVTDDGITLTWHEEAGKPFVTYMIGVFGVLFMWTSAMCTILALTVYKDR